MAELIDLKRKDFARAFEALTRALQSKGDPAIIRDSVLLRFSFTSELAWKVLRMVVAERGGKDALVPKAAWREARRLEFLSPSETETALKMVDDRNRLAHDYSEEFAKKLYARIRKSYFPLLKKVATFVRVSK
jgi:nucleotidyltransferase substrate binding protein (TIGR01987 family)